VTLFYNLLFDVNIMNNRSIKKINALNLVHKKSHVNEALLVDMGYSIKGVA